MRDENIDLLAKTLALMTAGGIAIGGAVLFDSCYSDVRLKKYIENMDENGEYIFYYSEMFKDYAIEYIALEPIINEYGNEKYTVPDGYHLLQDERGQKVGVIIYEVIKLDDGQELLYPVEMTEENKNNVKMRK